MSRYILMGIVSISLYVSAGAQLKVVNLLTDNLVEPSGIDNPHPRFSWQLVSPRRNTVQQAYEIRVRSNSPSRITWTSGKVKSPNSVLVEYQGPDFSPASTYSWQVRVWDNHGQSSGWSSAARWQTGIGGPENWKAAWITAELKEDTVRRPGQLFRKQFPVSRKLRSAVAFITSHGMYEAFINGKRLGKGIFTPGWTSYNKRLQYQAYDVTDILKQGQNAIGVALASGWYRTVLGWQDNDNIYGKTLGLLMQIHLQYEDGSEEDIVTDGSWKATDQGPVRSSELYNGETYDANFEQKNWSSDPFNDSKWKNVTAGSKDVRNIVATSSEDVSSHDTFAVKKLITTPKGEKVIDFGQNLVGWAEITVKGKKGDTIKITHAEVLDKEGNFYTANLRTAKQENIFVLNGEEQTYHPHFTFQGFRYIRIEGYNGDLQPKNFRAVALYSSMRPAGSFSCSDSMLNQLQHNIQWGQLGNFVDVPTDCPQRDERLGWTGDAQAFARTATFNRNSLNFFSKWLKDLAADQLPSGAVPHVIPNVLGEAGGSTGWSDAATIIPWTLYTVYGDTQILRQQYASMKAWVRYMEEHSRNDLWNTGQHFGDWLFYKPNDDLDGSSAVTDKSMIAQTFWANSTQLMIKTASVLGLKEDSIRYAGWLKRIKAAFMKEYVTPTGRLVSGTQTAYVLALNFDMLPDSLRPHAALRLVENVKRYDYHLTTGFLGTPYLCQVLSRFGYDDVAYKLLLQKTYPSWLYPVTMGATTIWERWDGQKPDSSFQTVGMNSFNHYAYGAIGDWMYRVVAGLDNAAPGYSKMLIHPHPDTSLNFAKARFESPYGIVVSGWERKAGVMTLNLTIPANTSAELVLPGAAPVALKENGKPVQGNNQFANVKEEGNNSRMTIGSGTYLFTYPLR